MTLVTHSGFIINTHNLSIRQDKANMPLSPFYGVDAISATMSYPTYFQEAKSYFTRHLYISDFKKSRLDKSSLLRMLNESVS